MFNIQLYEYNWGNNPTRKRLKGRLCFVLAYGKMNSVLIEVVWSFERLITDRRALRKV